MRFSIGELRRGAASWPCSLDEAGGRRDGTGRGTTVMHDAWNESDEDLLDARLRAAGGAGPVLVLADNAAIAAAAPRWARRLEAAGRPHRVRFWEGPADTVAIAALAAEARLRGDGPSRRRRHRHARRRPGRRRDGQRALRHRPRMGHRCRAREPARRRIFVPGDEPLCIGPDSVEPGLFVQCVLGTR